MNDNKTSMNIYIMNYWHCLKGVRTQFQGLCKMVLRRTGVHSIIPETETRLRCLETEFAGGEGRWRSSDQPSLDCPRQVQTQSCLCRGPVFPWPRVPGLRKIVSSSIYPSETCCPLPHLSTPVCDTCTQWQARPAMKTQWKWPIH